MLLIMCLLQWKVTVVGASFLLPRREVDASMHVQATLQTLARGQRGSGCLQTGEHVWFPQRWIVTLTGLETKLDRD